MHCGAAITFITHEVLWRLNGKLQVVKFFKSDAFTVLNTAYAKMPTVLLLDVSLSMSQPVTMADCSEEYQLRHLAVHGLNTLLDLSAEHSKLEFFSLVIYSSLWEQLVTFTRDYDGIKAVLDKVEDYDKTCLEGGLHGAANLLMNEWDVFTPSQIVLVTDGGAGVGQSSLQSLVQFLSNQKPENKSDDKLFMPFGFPCKLHVVCIGDANQLQQKGVVNMYQKLIDLNNQRGEVFVPDGPLTLKSVQAMFTKLSEKYFRPFETSLHCGNLECKINLYPPPDPHKMLKDFVYLDKKFEDKVTICGFLDIADAASPPIVCRHLVLPSISGRPNVETAASDGDEEEHDEGKNPAFTVLMHGALKVEGMVALTQISEDWFGILYSWADNKKKSNLVLSVFEPGPHVVSWLGNLNHLAPVCDFSEPPYGEEDNKTPFPVRPQGRRSYAQNSTVWIKPSGLQADIQKILRHARKLPEKQQHFYKELNRLRRSALCLGFHELLDAVSAMLERECQMLPGTAHPDAALQLTHATTSLRGTMAKDITQNIQPMRTNFTGD